MFDIEIQFKKNPPLYRAEQLNGCVQWRKKTLSYESLSYCKWGYKYHVVFIPKGRKKVLYGKIRKFLGPVFYELARQRGSKIGEGHMVVSFHTGPSCVPQV
jgi:hypothetical protein